MTDLTKSVEVYESNFVVFMEKVEALIKQGYNVDYERYPHFDQRLFSCHLTLPEATEVVAKTTRKAVAK